MFEVNAKVDDAHKAEIWTVSWKKQNIVTGSVDGIVKVWSPDNLQKLHEKNASSLGIVAVHSRGDIFLTSSIDGHLKIWNMETAELVKDIDATPMNTWQAKFQPGSNLVGTTGHSGNICLFNISGELVKTLQPNKGGFTTCINFSNDGKLLACGSKQGVVTVFDTGTGKTLHTIEAHSMTVRSLSFSPDGTTLVTTADDKYVNLFDTVKGEKIDALSGHNSWVLGCSYSSSGKYIATCSADKTVKIWSAGESECAATLNHHTGQVWGVSWNGSGDKLVSVGDDRSVIVYKCLSQ